MSDVAHLCIVYFLLVALVLYAQRGLGYLSAGSCLGGFCLRPLGVEMTDWSLTTFVAVLS